MRSKILLLTMASIFSPCFLVAGNAQAAGNSLAHSQSAKLFSEKCSMCHGEDGAGSAMGKSLSVPDLRSRAVQKASDATLVRFIDDGNGAMPSFKDQLSHPQILGLVRYVRHLGSASRSRRP